MTLDAAIEAYVKAFGAPPPMPVGPNDETIAEVLRAAVEGGQPVPDDFDWWGYVPPGGVA